MKAVQQIFLLFISSAFHLFVFAQEEPVYIFQQDDSLVKNNYYAQALRNNTHLLNSLNGQYKKDYKEIYENRFKDVADFLKGSRAVTSPEAHAYLLSVYHKITDANDLLKNMEVRLVFSRDWWPNAYSTGEGTLTINAGLMVFLNSEAELAFVLCHELAHYFRDHSNQAIKKHIETINSEEFKKEIARLKKQEYRVMQQLEALLKPLFLNNRRHSRENESEADKYAFTFMKNAGYDCGAIKTCLELFDRIDDTSIYKPIDLQHTFNFNNYPFRKKWIQKESVLFGEMTGDDSPLTKNERDSLKTHPDCSKRILLLKDSIERVQISGKQFLVNEKLFNRLKKEFIVEITEQEYRNKNLTRNLYYSISMMQTPEFIPVALFSIARCLNDMYDYQQKHLLGTMTEAESRVFPEDYNLLLRMVSRLKLDDIAALAYNFCNHYAEQMKNYKEFAEEFNRSKKRFN